MYQQSTVGSVRKYLFLMLCCSFLLMLGCQQYNVPTPEHWSDSLVLKESYVTEDRTVEDEESGSTLFTYHMYPTAQPIDVQKLDDNHWIAVFEKPEKTSSSRIRLERISEVEFRVHLETPSD